MPRAAWSRLIVALIALASLAVVSCFHDASDCPTCPGVDSGSIEVFVPQNGLVDSIHVRLDGGAQLTVRRNRRHAYENLSAGTHDVTITRWFYIDEILTSRSSSLQVRLDRGETRVIVFHNDFPLVTWAPMPDADPSFGCRVHGSIAQRMG